MYKWKGFQVQKLRSRFVKCVGRDLLRPLHACLVCSTSFQYNRFLCSDESKKEAPNSAQVVIAGGGVVGCSVAYHIAKQNLTDVIVLEQGSIGSGTTWHAAGLIGFLKSSVSQSMITSYAGKLYAELEEETGQGTGFKTCGSVIVAKSKDRARFIKRLADSAKQAKIECHAISPSEAGRLWPLLNTEDLQYALWIPNDGASTSSDVCHALIKGAKQKGVKLFEKTGVQKVVSDGKKVIGVETTKGYIECQTFINCCGLWSREIGMRSDPPVHVPLHACEHFYIVTKPMEMVHSMLPVLRDQDAGVYIREWSGGLMCGGFEAKSKPCFYGKIPDKFEFQLLPEDWAHFGENFMDGLVHRIPALENAEIRQFVNGPESFTSDGNQLIGEVPEIKNYFVAAGMNSAGIVCAAGVGKIISELVTEGKSSLDYSGADIKRFPRDLNNKQYLRERVKETLGRHYAIHYPNQFIEASRPMKTSALYEKLKSYGAVWGEIGGWERANWFDDANRGDTLTFGRPLWLDTVEKECYACRDRVGLVDMSWQTILQITGDNERRLIEEMQLIFGMDIDIKENTVITSALLDRFGAYVGVIDLLRTSANSFFAVVCPSQETRIKAWIESNKPIHSTMQIRPLAGAMSSISLLGPNSQALLETLCHPDVELNSIRKDSHKLLDLGYASDVRVVRGFMGDPQNWQLFIPSQYIVGLHKLLLTEGEEYGIKHVGHFSMDIIRTLRGMPKFGSELTGKVRPCDISVPYYVDVTKDCDFIGKNSFTTTTDSRKKRLSVLEFDQVNDDNWVWGGEPIFASDRAIGNVISATWDFNNKKLLGLALLDVLDLKGPLEVLVSGESYPVKVANE